MTNQNNDKQKVAAGTAQQHRPQTVQQTGQQQKQASPHDEKSCTNPNHSHGKDNMASGANKPNQNSKPAR